MTTTERADYAFVTETNLTTVIVWTIHRTLTNPNQLTEKVDRYVGGALGCACPIGVTR
ncbi:hypothetical protein ACXIUH_23330 [Vibrio parahaemolyticus]